MAPTLSETYLHVYVGILLLLLSTLSTSQCLSPAPAGYI